MTAEDVREIELEVEKELRSKNMPIDFNSVEYQRLYITKKRRKI